MQLHEVIWKDRFIDKIEGKHGVSTDEVEEVLFGIRTFVERKKVMLRERIYTLLTVRQWVGDT
jgi:hypothetical protein